MRRSFVLIAGLFCLSLSAQNINDVLRYGIEENQGTARFQAMGGAFGALGGDLSALAINPAGSSVFSHSQMTLSAANYHRDNDALYGNSLLNTDHNEIELNQLGMVFVFKSNDSPWKKLAVAFNYDMVENFENEFEASGTSTEGIDNYFLSFANGIPFGDILLRADDAGNPIESVEDAYLGLGENGDFAGQQAFLGYFGGIINPSDDSNLAGTTYVPNTSYNSVNHRYLQRTNGSNNKFALNFSGQYQDNLHLGASLNFHSIRYERLTLFDESGYTPGTEVQSTIFDNLLVTDGEGFSFSIGAIAKLNDQIRIGGAYQSPTWYRLRDNISQRIDSDAADTAINTIDFNTITFFPEYRINTPGKLTGSAALIFGKNGLLSFDYGYQDFSNAELRPSSDAIFAAENDFISNTLGVVNSFRLGGEYRIEQFSLRGGYRMEESPYENGDLIGDLEGFSAGIGYDFGGSRLDLAYSRTQQDVNELFFDSGATNSALVDRTNTNVVLSYTLKF